MRRRRRTLAAAIGGAFDDEPHAGKTARDALRLGAFGGGETVAAAVAAQEFLKAFLPAGQDGEVCDESGFELVSSWAMGDTLDDLLRAGEADVNLVVSSLGLACAEVLAEKYGTPHVVGCPIGTSASVELARLVRETTDDGGTRTLGSGSGTRGSGRLVTVIGEAVFAASLRQCLVGDLGEDNVRIACPLVDPCHMLGPDDVSLTSEEDAARTTELVQAKCPAGIEVTHLNGGQPVYYYIISVE